MNTLKSILLLTAVSSPFMASADLVAHFPMNIKSGQIVENISRSRFAVQGHFTPENVPGAEGMALRFDGYTTYVDARLGDIIPQGSTKMTVSLWTAIESYPIIRLDTDTSEKIAIASCLDETTKSGFGFYLGFNGKYSFRTFIGGWPVNIDVDTPMPTYQWNNLTAVIDCDSRRVTLYNNGTAVGSSRCSGSINMAASQFRMGKGDTDNYMGPFQLTSFNGAIDEIKIWDEAVPESTIQSWNAENPADLSIPQSRFADDILRPEFHGMPDAAWTNECHGMVYSDGRYHVFFQKNANGPYMARLHWGHISSENLYDWREEKIAITPGDPYDIKGCWSGCVFSDPQITGGRPGIIYTAVDYARATIAYASPANGTLTNWAKSSKNPIINGRPGGLSNDFRDPYFFRNGDKAYIIVGSSKNGIGTTTLHRYDQATSSWSNDGDLFFTGNSAAQAGTFWEMPNVTPMGNGQWLFTATPLNTSIGVRTLYWTGTIDDAGHFQPGANFSIPKGVELISRDGFGLLSPTIYPHNGKIIALGIVPDKLSGENNWNLGWAHCYSLPREWSLDTKGELVQKPFEGLSGMRSSTKFSKTSFDLDGNMTLDPVKGRAVEICGVFEVGSSPFGLKIFKNSSAEGNITYNTSTGEFTVDFSRLNRLINDGGVYNGIYKCSLPEFQARGSEFKLHIFIDHSIVDIFINDRWATSIRVFPTDTDADGIEAFSTSGVVKVKSLDAWVLDPSSNASVDGIIGDQAKDQPIDVYNLSGIKVKSGVTIAEAADNLPRGIYIAGGKKIFVD